MLIDTGAVLSLLPYSDAIVSTLRETAVTLTSASGEPIKTYGEVDVVLGFRAIGREFPWRMVVADVTQPILGIYFLSKNKTNLLLIVLTILSLTH